MPSEVRPHPPLDETAADVADARSSEAGTGQDISSSTVESAPGSPASSGAMLEGRLHPLTILFSVWSSIRRLLIPAIPMVIFGGRVGFGLVLSVILSATIIRALVRYYTFTYRIEGGELVTRQGILEHRERHIKLERLQEIRLEQGVLHRVFDVVDVLVETAGGQGPEASLSVLSRQEAERLRDAATAHVKKRQLEGSAPAPEGGMDRVTVRQLSFRDLLLAGVSSNHLATALILVGTLWAFIDDILPEGMYEKIGESVYGAVENVLSQGTQTAIALVIIGFAAVLLISAIGSVITLQVLFYGFTLSRVGEDLHRSYGLLTRRSSSLPRRRIQVLEIEEGMFRRLFGLATIRADTAGSKTEESGEKRMGRDVLLPVIHRDEVATLLPVFFPDFEPDPVDWRRVSRKAIRRGTFKGAVLCLILTAGMVLSQGIPLGLWPLALLPAAYGINIMRYQNLGYVMGERYFRTRRGWLSRSTHIVPIRNIQAVVIRRTPMDRYHGLATLIVDTAGQAYTGGGPRISNLPVEEACSIARTLAQRAAATRYRW